MIEIDKEVVELSRDYLPQWQDCSSIAHHKHKGAAEWCFDDARATTKFDDAMKYFLEFDDKAYDLIIMDALDPNDDIPFAVELYTSDDYIRSLFNALNPDGILVVQVGESPNEDSPADEVGTFANRAMMKNKLVEVGFKRLVFFPHMIWPSILYTYLKVYTGRLTIVHTLTLSLFLSLYPLKAFMSMRKLILVS